MGKEEPDEQNIGIRYSVRLCDGRAFVRVLVDGEDKFLLTMRQASDIGLALIEAAAKAEYEQATFQTIKANNPEVARSVIEKIRGTMSRIKSVLS